MSGNTGLVASSTTLKLGFETASSISAHLGFRLSITMVTRRVSEGEAVAIISLANASGFQLTRRVSS